MPWPVERFHQICLAVDALEVLVVGPLSERVSRAMASVNRVATLEDVGVKGSLSVGEETGFESSPDSYCALACREDYRHTTVAGVEARPAGGVLDPAHRPLRHFELTTPRRGDASGCHPPLQVRSRLAAS